MLQRPAKKAYSRHIELLIKAARPGNGYSIRCHGIGLATTLFMIEAEREELEHKRVAA